MWNSNVKSLDSLSVILITESNRIFSKYFLLQIYVKKPIIFIKSLTIIISLFNIVHFLSVSYPVRD